MSDRVYVESLDPAGAYPVAATYRNYSVGTAAVQHLIVTDAASDVQAKVFSYATSNPQAMALTDTTGTHKYPVDVVGSVGATQLGSPWGVTGSVQATQAGAPWTVTGSVGATQLAGPWTVTGSVLVQGQVASGTVFTGNPVGVGGLAFDFAQTSVTQVGCGQMVALIADRMGRRRIAVDTGNLAVTGSVGASQLGSPWSITGSTGATQLGAPWTVTGSVLVQGQVASGAVFAGNPVGLGALAFDTAQTSWTQVGCGQLSVLVSDRQGRQRIAVDTGNILAAQGGGPWTFTGSAGATQLGAPWTFTGCDAIQGQVANGAVAAGNPVLIAGFATTSGDVTAQASGDAVALLTDLYGKPIVHMYAGPDNWWSAVCSTISTSATVMVYSYGTAGRKLYLGSLILGCQSVSTNVLIVDGGSGTAPTASNIVGRIRVANNLTPTCTFEPPIRVSSGLCIACVTSGSNVDGTFTGFTAP